MSLLIIWTQEGKDVKRTLTLISRRLRDTLKLKTRPSIVFQRVYNLLTNAFWI